MTQELHLVTQLDFPGLAEQITAQGPVRITHLPMGEPLPPDLQGDALLTVAVGNPQLPQLLEARHGFRWIHVFGTGVDGFPLDQVGERLLTCSRGATAEPIAEWVAAMLLSAAKRLPESWISAPPAQWHMASLSSLRGATLGLVGLGSIGEAVAAHGLHFGMQVQALVRRPRSAPPPGIQLVDSLPRLLASSDHVVVAAPATAATRHMINADSLAHARPGLHLINVARGSLVEQEALHAALEDGRIGLASLDVVDPEPLPDGHWLYSHPRVRLSPHVSWSAPDVFGQLLQRFIDNIGRYLRDEPLAGVVDVAAGY